MTKKEAQTVHKLLKKVKDPGPEVRECIAIMEKQLAIYDRTRGQLKDSYDDDYFRGW